MRYKDQGYETHVVVPYTGIHQALREERQDELQYAGGQHAQHELCHLTPVGRYISEKESEVTFPVSPLVLHPVELRPRFQQERRPGILPVHLGTDPAPLEFLLSIGDKSRRRVRYVELPFPYLVANHEMPLVPVQYAG